MEFADADRRSLDERIWPSLIGYRLWTLIKCSVNLGILDRLKSDLLLRKRRGIFGIFMRACAPTPNSRVADFGVSRHLRYFFEGMYPYRTNLAAIARAIEDTGWSHPVNFQGCTSSRRVFENPTAESLLRLPGSAILSLTTPGTSSYPGRPKSADT